MELDKQILREAIAHYENWNDEKLLAQFLQRKKKTPAEKWRAYQDLYAFGRQLKPKPSRWERLEKAEAWQAYYARIRKFEVWRRRRAEIA